VVNYLHIVDSLTLGGAQRVLKALFESPRDTDHLGLYVLRDSAEAIHIKHPKVTIFQGYGRYSIKPLWSLVRLVRQRKITVVHCHLFRSQIFGLIIRVFFNRRSKIVFHEHGRIVGRENEPRIQRFLFKLFTRVSSVWVDSYVCNSDFTAIHLSKLLHSTQKIVVINNPIPKITKLSPEEKLLTKKQLNIPAERFVVGFAGRFIETKGWREFLLAVKFSSLSLDIHFVIAGQGPDKDLLMQRIDSLQITNLGNVIGLVSDMRKFFSAIDCFVMPSLWESHGLVQLEAQAFGVPIIVSNVAGLRDTVQPEINALLADGGDAQHISDQILKIATDQSLQRALIHGGLQNVHNYSVPNYISRLRQLEERLSQ